ncbi:MAG: type II toxin-antitoxin system RelE/ParE family toxin [Rhizomicrobium sp.]
MACTVEYTDEFGRWWASLDEGQQEDVAAYVALPEERDVRLRHPYSSAINGSRVFYAFDPRRMAILLIGGDKTGDDRFYETFIPIADRLYDEHLVALKKEGLLP